MQLKLRRWEFYVYHLHVHMSYNLFMMSSCWLSNLRPLRAVNDIVPRQKLSAWCYTVYFYHLRGEGHYEYLYTNLVHLYAVNSVGQKATNGALRDGMPQ